MKKLTNRIVSGFAVASMAIAMMTGAASAASWDNSIIHVDDPASITIHKYDFTNAAKDGVWDSSYVSTGKQDSNVEEILGNKPRHIGDPNGQKDHVLGNGETSNGYAIKGVEFSYVRVADIMTFTESANDQHPAYNMTKVLYGFDKVDAADLLTAIGLPGGLNSYVNAPSAPSLDTGKWWYESDVLNKALASALTADVTGVTDLLETFIADKVPAANQSQANNHADANNRPDAGRMLYTDENGYTTATNLETGLYLLVETVVPEMVTSTTAPFFLSLPMTRVNGGGGMTGSVNETEGGHEWNYHVELYPKNETGIVTLEKTVRETKADTGKNTNTDTITDGFAHNATASTGDVVEYQIITTLPSITSKATALSQYQFDDAIAPGMTYTARENVKIQWYTDAACTNLVDTWNYADGYFDVVTDNDAHTRRISINANGLAIVNGLAATAGNVNNGVIADSNLPVVKNQNRKFAGYSNYTARVTYTATLDSDNSFVYGDAGNKNTVDLTWKRSSNTYYDILRDDCHVYSYGIDLTKLFTGKTQDEAYGDGSEAQNMFNHVKFKVRNITTDNGIHDAGYYVKAAKNEAEGVWYVTGHSTKEADATIFYPLKPTNYPHEAGHIIIKGLEDDSYELTEIETADGFRLLKDRITVKINTAETDTFCNVYDTESQNGVHQNDKHYDGTLFSARLPLANIPQTPLAHHLLTASATVDNNAVTMLNDFAGATGVDNGSANALVPLTVENTPGFDLPETGSEGAQILPMIGAAIICVSMAAMFVVFFVNKKNTNDN